MGPYGMMYLIGSIVAFAVFAGALAYYSQQDAARRRALPAPDAPRADVTPH